MFLLLTPAAGSLAFATSISNAPWSLICLLIALILFALAALNIPSARVSLGWAGMFFFALGLTVR